MRVITTNENFSIEEPELPYSIGKISPGLNQIYSAKSLMFCISTPFVYNEGYSYDF